MNILLFTISTNKTFNTRTTAASWKNVICFIIKIILKNLEVKKTRKWRWKFWTHYLKLLYIWNILSTNQYEKMCNIMWTLLSANQIASLDVQWARNIQELIYLGFDILFNLHHSNLLWQSRNNIYMKVVQKVGHFLYLIGILSAFNSLLNTHIHWFCGDLIA